jgi:hypothetical protein
MTKGLVPVVMLGDRDRSDRDFHLNHALHPDSQHLHHTGLRDRLFNGSSIMADPDITGIATKVCGASVLGRIVRKSPIPNKQRRIAADLVPIAVDNGEGHGRCIPRSSHHSSLILLKQSDSSGTGGPSSINSDFACEDSFDSIHSRSYTTNSQANQVNDRRHRRPSLASADSLTSAGAQDALFGFSLPGSPDSLSTSTSEFSIPRMILRFDPSNPSGMVGHDAKSLELASSSITPRIRNTQHGNSVTLDLEKERLHVTNQTIDELNPAIADTDGNFKAHDTNQVEETALPQESDEITDEQDTSVTAPITNFIKSFRTSQWTLSLPAVVEEPATFDSEDGAANNTARSIKSLISTDSIESDKARTEILEVMKELVQKQQAMISDLNDQNIKHKEKEVEHRDSMKQLKQEKHEVQRQMIELMVHQEKFLSETEYLRAEIKALRNAVREMNINPEKEAVDMNVDVEVDENINLDLNALENEENNDHYSKEVQLDMDTRVDRSVLSPANRSVTTMSTIPSLRDRLHQSNKTTKKTKKEKMDKSIFREEYKRSEKNVLAKVEVQNENSSSNYNDHVNAPAIISASYQDELDADAFIQELGQEVTFNPRATKDVNLFLGRQQEGFIEKDPPKNFKGSDNNIQIDSLLNVSISSRRTSTNDESSILTDDDATSILTADSKITATEVALFKSRLETIQHRRIRRQRESSIQQHQEVERNAKGPVVRFSYETQLYGQM